MKIDKNTVVSVSYDLHASESSQERVYVETAGKEKPLVFLFGSGSLIPTFENNLQDLQVGAAFEFDIPAADAYGEFEQEAIVELPVDIFKVNGVIEVGLLTVGNTIPMSDNQGNRMNGVVRALSGETVTMDFNHPLAGKTLHFKGEVVAIRPATAEEVSHGHVHDGSHHH